MSAASINQIYEEFAAKAPEACAGGSGEDLFNEFLAATAVDFADGIFLKMDAELGKVDSDERTAEGWAWAQVFPEHSALQLLDGVADVLLRFDATPEMIDAAQTVSATAYRDRLETLFALSASGGAA